MGKAADYGKFFAANATMTIPQTGVYRGPANIMEYVMYAGRANPLYMNTNYPDVPSNIYLRSIDQEKEVCQFITMDAAGYVVKEEYSASWAHPFIMSNMQFAEYSPHAGKIT